MKNIAFTVTVPEELLVSYIESANIGYWGDIISRDPETLIMTMIEDEFLVDAPEDSDRTVDWDPKNVLVVGAFVALGVVGMGIYLTAENDKEQYMCMHAGGTVEFYPVPHSHDWNCKKPPAEKP